MKKLLALLLALLMLLTMVACAADESDDVDGVKVDEQETKLEKKVELSRGKIQSGVYVSEFLEIQFTKPDSWVYSSDEEIAQMVSLSVEAIAGDRFKEALEKTETLYDMMVVDSVTRSNIIVSYENLTKTLSTNITMDQYVEALKSQLKNVTGMTVTFPENLETAKLGDTEFTKVLCTTTMQGSSMTQIYYLKKIDKYMCAVIVTVPSGYTVAQIEAMFQ